MERVKLREFRGHHIKEIFFQYIDEGRFPTYFMQVLFDDWTQFTSYPILVTDSIDDWCRKCSRTYPAINFCKGKKIKLEDQEAARILGIKIGKPYTARTLTELFEQKAKELKIRIGANYNRQTLEKMFYGDEKP